MCSIILLRQSDNEWPIIIGANRDEMSNRKSLPPSRHWDDRPYIFAGKDLEAGGTWLGINDYGVCLLYTSPSPRDGLLSRMPSSA